MVAMDGSPAVATHRGSRLAGPCALREAQLVALRQGPHLEGGCASGTSARVQGTSEVGQAKLARRRVACGDGVDGDFDAQLDLWWIIYGKLMLI